jgi:hypothetical protein
VEKLQLRPTFPDKPLTKTYVALWENCRSIATLQLLFLEIFDLVDIFGSYAISKMLEWNQKGGTRHCHRALRVVRALRPRRPRGVLAMPRRTVDLDTFAVNRGPPWALLLSSPLVHRA